MKTGLIWRIYYGDGSTFDNLQGEPKDAPSFNVQVIIQIDPKHGRRSVSIYDYYYYRDNRWWGGDLAGFIDYLETIGILSYDKNDFMPVINNIPMDGFRMIMYATHRGLVKLGRYIEKEAFYKITAQAESDEDFPFRTAWYAEERTRQGEGKEKDG